MLKKFKFILLGLTLLLFIGVVNAAPSITPDPAVSLFNSTTDELPYDFSVSINEDANITWYVNGSSVQSVENRSSDTYTADESAGVYNVSVSAVNSNGTDSFSWTWTVTEPLSNESLLIDSSSPGSDPSTTVGDSQVFTVDTNQIADIVWSIDGTAVQTNSSQTSASYTNSTAPVGTYEVKATASNVNGTANHTWTWEVTAVSGPSITLDDPSSSSVSDDTGASRTFKVLISQIVNLTWILDGTTLTTNNSVTTSSHTFSSAPEGSHNLTVYVENTNGTDQKKWDWNVTTPSSSSSAPNASFKLNVTEGEAPLVVMFNDTSTNSPTSWEWDFGDGGTSDKQNISHTFVSTGTYNITLTVENGDGTDEVTKSITVYAQNFHTGDRIWDENANQSTDYYIWDAKSFSGFFYDLESGFSSENMTIYNIDRSIDEGDIVYQTSPTETDFEYSGWGSYQVIGFMAEKYFAGYTENTEIDDVDEVSMISAGQLSKVLIDNDDKTSVYAGSSLTLEEGYDLNIAEVDVNGESVLLSLTKDGDKVDSAVVSSGDDYVYKTDLGDADDVVIIAAHIEDVFSSKESDAIFIQGLFQISDEYEEIDDGDSIGEMEVTSVSDDLIVMKNSDTVSLSKGDTFNLMGSINIIVADNSDLRFAPYVDMTEPGTYELRGTVNEGESLITWTPLNFEGFYYDIDEGIQTETLELQAIDGRTIDSGDLVYTSTARSVEFEHSGWGDFDVIGFMAEKYFVGYNNATDIDDVDDDISLLSSGVLSKVLLDDDDKVSVYSGSSLVLEDGYTLDIVEVDNEGDRVLIELYKDGDQVDSDIASSDSDYVYKTDLGDADDVPVIIVHFNDIFNSAESSAVFVQGIFQVSEDYIELESGKNFDEMEIDSFSDTKIVMSNDGSLSLNKDNDIELMGDVGIRVADSSTLRYYPYVEVTTAASESLSVELSDDTVIEGDDVTITVTSRGAAVSDVTLKLDGNTLGTTEDGGTYTYTPTTAGTYEITAEKDGYATGSADLEVIDADDQTKKMTIEVSPSEVYEGSSVTIYVLQAIGNAGISGVEVTYDGKSIGTTGSDGSLTYTPTETGNHKLIATKSGLIDAEYDLTVEELAAKFEFSNLEITPLEIKQGQEATISVNATNTGSANGSYTLELKVNDVVAGSQSVSLDPGESTTVEFTHTEDEVGTYTVAVGGLSKDYEVFEKTSVIWYVLGAIGLVIVGAVAYLFTAGGWNKEIAQAKAEDAVESIKEFIGSLR